MEKQENIIRQQEKHHSYYSGFDLHKKTKTYMYLYVYCIYVRNIPVLAMKQTMYSAALWHISILIILLKKFHDNNVVEPNIVVFPLSSSAQACFFTYKNLKMHFFG